MTKDELLRRTLEDLGKHYCPGLYEYLYKYHKDLYKQLQEIEDKIDNAFLFESEQGLMLVLKG